MFKTTKIGLALLALFVFSMFAIAESTSGPGNPYKVYGKTMINGNVAKAMKVTLTNTNTGDSDTFVSTSSGDYGFNLEQFPNGYAQGHQLKIEYCISDTRCNQDSDTAIVTSGYLRHDINAPYAPIGSCGSYPVYGSVIVDSQSITSGTMNIKNHNTGNSIDVDIEPEGYQGNLANINSCYNTGDDIRFTYGSYTYDFYVDGRHEIDFIYTSPVTPPDGGGGGGGGGGGSGPDQQQGTPPDKPETPEEPTEPTEPTEPEDVPEEIEGGEDGPEVIDIDTEGKAWIWILIIVVIIVGAVAYFVMRKPASLGL